MTPKEQLKDRLKNEPCPQGGKHHPTRDHQKGTETVYWCMFCRQELGRLFNPYKHPINLEDA